ncbi:GxxExxY protein [Desulfonema ishimotonii]|uniref:GxxExxY protein n=1 Tax=Desulfonema ishimotonii TaxID=45657 RepID=A0A401FRD1_9BACT|nr:GxxExxY protein [Desulfonema ishimotonii]GBC59515.1 GxxExxY protein [Desulfonema ishimotonii]
MTFDDPLTHEIIGAAMTVHNALGTGFMEVVYQRSLAIEFHKRGIPFERERKIPIYYDGQKVGVRRVDFLVNQRVLVELKAVSVLNDLHLAQAINYLKVFQLDVGLLMNFGGVRLEFRRLFRKK